MAQDTSRSVWDTIDNAIEAYAKVLQAKYQAAFAAAKAQQEALLNTPDRYRNAQAKAGDYIPPASPKVLDQRTLMMVGGLLLAGVAAWAILSR